MTFNWIPLLYSLAAVCDHNTSNLLLKHPWLLDLTQRKHLPKSHVAYCFQYMTNTEFVMYWLSNSCRPLVQVQSYLSEVPISRSDDAVNYWRINNNCFPVLGPRACAYLSAPCTRVDSERLFSLPGNVTDEKRNRLTGDKAETLLFSKKNLPLMYKWLQLCVFWEISLCCQATFI